MREIKVSKSESSCEVSVEVPEDFRVPYPCVVHVGDDFVALSMSGVRELVCALLYSLWGYLPSFPKEPKEPGDE